MTGATPITAAFDLAAYLERIRLKESPSADVEGLLQLQRAHRLAIPFENLDIPLGRGISLAPDDIFEKIVRHRRGGYCFEQNALFLRALEAIGFAARPLMARVWLGVTETPPRTHMLNLVEIEGQSWIADAGFGGSFVPPMRLAENEVASPDGALHRLIQDDVHGWMLLRRGANPIGESGSDSEWSHQYSFTTERVWPADLAQANHFTATMPNSRFTANSVVSIVLPNGFATLLNRDYSRSSAKGVEKAEIASPKAYQLRLSMMFGIDLSIDDVMKLGLFAA